MLPVIGSAANWRGHDERTFIHNNTTDSGVRIIHCASGAVGESRSERSQHQNKKIALDRLTRAPKFKLWVQRIAFEMSSGKTIEQRVNETMVPGNLKVEIVGDDGKWEDE